MHFAMLTPLAFALLAGGICAGPLLGGSFSARDGSDLPEVSAALPVKHDAGADQIFLRRNLKATFYFTCPIGGRLVRDFEWHAGYSFAQERIYIHAIRNIGSFDPIVTNPPSFWTRWHASLCTQVHDLYCTYYYSARTEGTVSTSSIVMSIITGGTDPERNPVVREYCVPPFGTHTCAINPSTRNPICEINDIIVAIA